MISLKNFNLSRLLSQQVAPVCLGRELQGSNVFLDFFGCVSLKIARRPSGEATALQTLNGALRDLFFDDYWCVVIHEIEKLDDVGVAHPNAAAAGGSADFAFVLRAVDINETLARVGIVLVQSVQP